MIRLWLIGALVLTIIDALLLIGVRLQQANPAAMDALGDCALPCWQGVQPGVTPAQEAVSHLTVLNHSDSFQAPCQQSHSFTCLLYIWSQPEASNSYTQVEVDAGRLGTLIVVNPGITLGDAILTLHDSHVELNGADPSFTGDKLTLYTEVMFADSHVVMDVVAPCSERYALMQMPIRTLEIDPLQSSSPYTTTATFADVRRLFYETCTAALP